MAKIEDLIEEIGDSGLALIANEVKELKATKSFGLLFEEHIPEAVSLHGLPIRPGTIVQNRATPEDTSEFRFRALQGDPALVTPKGLSEPSGSFWFRNSFCST